MASRKLPVLVDGLFDSWACRHQVVGHHDRMYFDMGVERQEPGLCKRWDLDRHITILNLLSHLTNKSFCGVESAQKVEWHWIGKRTGAGAAEMNRRLPLVL
jgi:hypothetical protein